MGRVEFILSVKARLSSEMYQIYRRLQAPVPDRRYRVQIASEMLGRGLRTSATRLGTFAACPYRYFTRYLLELEPRQQFELKPLDVGRFYHCVLDALLKRLNELKINFADINDKNERKLI